MRKLTKKPVRRVSKKPAKAVKKKTKSKVRHPLRRKIVFRPLASIASSELAVKSPARFAATDHRLPPFYGEDKLVLLVRDPWWLFAYWELTQARQDEVAEQVRRAGHRDWKTVVRVYDVTQSSLAKPRSFFDIELNFYTDNWYIDVGLPDREWMAQMGLRTANGRFFVLLSSNKVHTPSFGISDVLDEEWLLPDEVYYRLIGMSGLNAQQGSMDVRKLLEKYLKRLISSERLPQVSQKS